MMIGNLIELQFGQGRNWPLGAALSITLMAIVMVALLVYVRNAGSVGGAPWLSAFSTSARQPGFTAIAAILLRRCSTLPIVVLVVYSFNDGDLGVATGTASRCAGSWPPGTTQQVIDASLALAADRLVGGGHRNDRRDHGGAGDDADAALSRPDRSNTPSSTSR